MELVHLAGKTGEKQNVGGHTGRWRWTPILDLTTIQKKLELGDPAVTAPEDLVNIPGNHTWAATKGYYEFNNTRDTGKSDFEMNQERDTTGVTTKAVAKYPGADAEAFGVFTAIANTNGIAWFELAEGGWEQLGSERYPAEVKFKWSSGAQQGGYRGFEISVDAFETTFQIYAGTMTKFVL